MACKPMPKGLANGNQMARYVGIGSIYVSPPKNWDRRTRPGTGADGAAAQRQREGTAAAKA